MTLGAELAAATALLTRLPVSGPRDRPGAAAFGFVGAGLGLAAAVPLVVLGPVAPLAAGALTVGLLALASGALHLDGLADTADALAAPNAEAAERARLDPRSGPAGVAMVAVAVVLDAALLAALVDRSNPGLGAVLTVVAASGSRAAAGVAAAAGLRRREGFGSWFAARTSRAAALAGAAVPVVLGAAGAVVLAEPAILLVTPAALIAGCVAAAALARLRDGLDGDGLGASVEVAFSAALVVAVLVA